MEEILLTDNFNFPYTDLHFPGLNTGEKILFVTRESSLILKFRIIGLYLATGILIFLGWLLLSFLSSYIAFLDLLMVPLLLFGAAILLIGFWWITSTYKKSVFIITSRRLTKIIYTTPFTWYQFSLGLDEIADTGSYSSSYFEAFFKLGYFVARSGAGSVKNFKIVNITFAQDLHNYVNKLLYAFKHHKQEMHNFRPFIPHLKGEKRKKFLEKYPEYKTEF